MPESRTASLIVQTIVLAVLAFSPTLLFYFLSPSGAVSSLAPGTILACIVAMGIVMLGRHRAMTSIRVVDFMVYVGLILFVIAAHFVVAMLVGGGFEPLRSILSCVLLVLMFMGSLAIATILAENDDSIDRAVAIVRWILIVFGVLSIAGLRLWPGGWEKPVFPFTEPSHFALMLNPFLAHAIFGNKGIRRGLWLSAGLVIAYESESLTLLVCVMAAGVMCMSLRGILFFTFIAITGLGLVDLSYFTDRLNFGSDTRNISSLVYIQGWELLRDSIERTSGWGIGFQQLGYGPFNSPAADLLYSITASDFNLTDGGFLLSKFISELGVIGIFLMLAYVFVFARSLMAFRLYMQGLLPEVPRSLFFSLCVICSFSIDIVVRGLGYFSGQSLLFLSALCIMLNGKALLARHKRAHRREVGIDPDGRYMFETERSENAAPGYPIR